ncbi:MAG TPA: hypothetical protein VF733_06430 [Candidatus Saccharimonadales bacterium]
MTTDEAFTHIKNTLPATLYVSGKTSTGKSTFAAKLKERCGYEIVELDKIVTGAVIKPLRLPDEKQVFVEIYRLRNHPDWIERFITAAKQEIAKHQKSGKKIVIDGAVGNPITLNELLRSLPDTKILYFHPKNLPTYEQYLTSRFMLANPDFHAGLPGAFWQLIDDAAFRQFCKDHKLTTDLQRAIAEYAALSQSASIERLKEFQPYFNNLEVVEV